LQLSVPILGCIGSHWYFSSMLCFGYALLPDRLFQTIKKRAVVQVGSSRPSDAKRRNIDVPQGFHRGGNVADQSSWRNVMSRPGRCGLAAGVSGALRMIRNAPRLAPHGFPGNVAALRQNPGRAVGAVGAGWEPGGGFDELWMTAMREDNPTGAIDPKRPDVFRTVPWRPCDPQAAGRVF